MRYSFSNKNEFSWSLARHNLFCFCKKAYYFNYYASWGGWNSSADTRQKLIYRLKQIKTEREWVDAIFLESISKAILKGIDPTPDAIRKYIFRKAYTELGSISRCEYLRDPKKLCLFENYYLKDSEENIKTRITEGLNPLFNSLNSEEFLKLLRKNFLDFISLNELKSFQIGSFKIWIPINFIYYDNDEIVLENYRFNDFREDQNWHISSAIALLYGIKTLLRHNKKLTAKTSFIYKGKFLGVYSTLNPIETTGIILTSARKMIDLDSSDMRENNFPQCEQKEKCRACKFHEVCAAETV
ncbi:MAG TPA: hypothetical protein DD381_00675 [Lentisphaeria bacterium]|nr:MAG: hypothetical protein A2X47_00345 [Lentisphaerae bacterium GWF2_38_69]HBM14856.1 hypothetical protein [Lentisphaeria bacterium]